MQEVRPMKRRRRLVLGLVGFGLGVAAISTALKRMEQQIRPPHPRLALRSGRLLLSRPPRRALVITAHPDDLELLLGGTLALLSQSGTELTVVDLTDGELGAHRRHAAELRQREQSEAAEILEYAHVEFLHLPDRELSDVNVAAALWQVWLRVRPEAVFAFDAEHFPNRLRHPDHLAGGRAAMAMARASGGQVPLYFYGTSRPDHVVDISPVIGQKVAAVQAHQSQLLIGRRLCGPGIRLLGRLQGKACGLVYAEGLRLDQGC
jgi:LmbE family N-acetylglucosaminyl deacetylase